MNKYGNKKTTIDNITFDSKAESERYAELKLLKQAGEVLEFSLQPKFELQPGFSKDGKKYRPIVYIADFDVTWKDGRREIIDIKSEFTRTLRPFKIKQKLFDYKFPDLTLVAES